MEPTNIKVGEYVGVYHDSKDGSFHFDTISAEEYDTAKFKELDRINTKHTKALEMIIKAGYENCN